MVHTIQLYDAVVIAPRGERQFETWEFDQVERRATELQARLVVLHVQIKLVSK